MMLNKLVKEILVNNDMLNNLLTKYSGQPAVFNKRVPKDEDPGWASDNPYPRVIFSENIHAYRKRKCYGSLKIQIMCHNSLTTSEEIEAVIIDCLNDTFLKPAHSNLYGISWAKSETFHERECCEKECCEKECCNELSDPESDIDTLEVYFDILEYPCSEISDPDPIRALAIYLKSLFPNAVNLGIDYHQEVFQINAIEPVFYLRLVNVNTNKETNTAMWMNSKIAVHVFAPTQELRMKWVTDLVNQLALDGEYKMLDETPIFVKDIKVNGRADYLKDGQILLTVEYGMQRYKRKNNMVLSTTFSLD